MSRGKVTVRKKFPVDPVYHNRALARFINRVMRDGKKAVAQKNVYQSLDLIKRKMDEDPLEVFLQAIENVKPQMEVRPRRVGGASYQIPIPVRPERKESLAVRWLVLAARGRSNKEYRRFSEKLAAELMDAYNKQGGAIKKKDDVHRAAEANKAFAHFRW